MANQAREATWKAYQDAWADIAPEKRQDLLRQSVAEDCIFSSPSNNGRGAQALIAMIEDFQKMYPRASFRNHKMIEHHDEALAEWTMYDKSGAAFLPGKSYARFGLDGRLTQLSGFWEL